MAVINVHERALPATTAEVDALIGSLAGEQDRLWPHQTWPPMRFDRPLEIGAVGGHGPIRYTVTQYVPGQWLRCRFTGPRGVHGFHEFTWRSQGDHTVLRHTLAIHAHGPARFTWPLIFRPLHDALLEDLMDRAEQATSERVARPARWSPYVRLLRGLASLRPSRPPRSTQRSTQRSTRRSVSSDAR